MTVAELLAALATLPPDAIVRVWDMNSGGTVPSGQIENHGGESDPWIILPPEAAQ